MRRDGAVAGVDVRGAAPGTRETDLLRPVNLVEQVHAVLLTGGSAFGLDAAGGVMRWLEERDIGLDAAARGADRPGGGAVRPGRGRRARPPRAPTRLRRPARRPPRGAGPQGSVGAGTGATVGKLFGIDARDEGRHRHRVVTRWAA